MKPYTVKVPAQWVGVNSTRAQTYLREFFIHPLTLPADPGAGERVLRLTLSARQVDALSRGSGDVPAVALRRLLTARVRELPAAACSIVESRPIPLVRSKVSEAKPVPHSESWADEPLLISEWSDSSNPDGGGATDTQHKAAQQVSAPERGLVWPADLWAFLLLIGLGVLLILVARKLGWFAVAVAEAASAAPAFPAWRPE